MRSIVRPLLDGHNDAWCEGRGEAIDRYWHLRARLSVRCLRQLPAALRVVRFAADWLTLRQPGGEGDGYDG